MLNPAQLLKYLRISVDELVQAGQFPGGQAYKPTQARALKAFREILYDDQIPIEDRLTSFFAMPQGTGKTPLFLGIIYGAMKAASLDGINLRSMIVAPTNKILEQTVMRAKEFFPGLENKIGLYGGKHKNRKNPITVITYNSWLKLIETGMLTEDDVDLLISDEGHRGTSQRRVLNLGNEFKNVAKYAFTATPAFNKVKGVALTHGSPVYSAKFRDSIEIGELAAYYQTLFYIIRVLPASLDVIEAAKEAGLKNYESERRKQAWSERVVAILRDTIDPQTGDPISDNQGAIFCKDTSHANSLTALLNADPVLKAKAISLGMKGVCVQVHSRLSRKTHKEYLNSYEAGEYLFVAGDEQLKEGWDYPPAKTLVDYYHHSLVDKEQILGRVGREWENPFKGRMEGAIAIDILTYTGHPDPKIDALRRKEALRKAVLAWEIMGDHVVLGPEQKIPELNHAAKPEKKLTPIDVAKIIGQEIEAYTTLESLQLIKAEHEDIKSGDYVDITPELRQKIISELERTSASLSDIAGTSEKTKPLPDNMEQRPEGLTTNTINGWIHNLETPKGNKVQIEWVLKYLSFFPDDPTIEITPQRLGELKKQFLKSGISAGQLIRNCADLPKDLHEIKINRWLNGYTIKEKKRLLDYVTHKLEAIIKGEMPIVVYDDMVAKRLGRSQATDITDSEVEKLRSLSLATGMAGTEVLKYADNKHPVPKNLTRNQIDAWKSGTKSGLPVREHFDFVIDLYQRVLKSFQDRGLDPRRVDISPTVRQQMIEWNKIVSNGQLIRTPGAPDDLPRSVVYCWLSGDSTTARKYHLDFALKTWPELVKKKLDAKTSTPKPSI